MISNKSILVNRAFCKQELPVLVQKLFNIVTPATMLMAGLDAVELKADPDEAGIEVPLK